MKEDKLQEICRKVFHPLRTPRSVAYQAGFRACLGSKLGYFPKVELPYKPGTPNADAWFAGVDEAHSYYRKHGRKLICQH